MSQLDNLSAYQERINQFLEQKLADIEINDPKLIDAMRYGLLIGGKRMRPYLTYITGTALNASIEDLDGVAAALECIHAYSLLHDDLPAMDDDALRRGQPTCHIKFDEATAILAGDALQTLAFEILSNHNFTQINASQQLNLVKFLSHASGYLGMCGGQAMDLAATDKSIALAELEKLHLLKTGALLRAAVLMAAECAPGITQEEKQYLETYAQAVGLAYQVRDDIIDITSSEEELGKPAGSDLAANKSTYPSLLGLQGAQQKAEDLYVQSLQALSNLTYNTQNLAEFATFIIHRSH